MNDSAIFGMLGLLIGGAGVWAVMRLEIEDGKELIRQRDFWKKAEAHRHKQVLEAIYERDDAHSRLSDAHNTQSARIERALDQVTEGANATVVRMAAILRGER